MRGWFAAFALLTCAGLSACATTAQTRLFDALGGEAGLRKLVAALIVEYRADPRISPIFAETDFDYFADRLYEDLCVTTDGGCEYEGLPLEEAHSGMNIREAEFNWFVEDSQRAMDKLGIAVGLQNRLLERLARQRGEVIRQ